MNARQDQQVVLNILVQDSAKELSRLARRLREAQAEAMAKDHVISQYQQIGADLASQEAIIGVCSSCILLFTQLHPQQKSSTAFKQQPYFRYLNQGVCMQNKSKWKGEN